MYVGKGCALNDRQKNAVLESKNASFFKNIFSCLTKENGSSFGIDVEVIQDKRQLDDNDLQVERQDQPEEEEAEHKRSKKRRTEKSFGPDFVLLCQAHYVDKILNAHNAGDFGLARTSIDTSTRHDLAYVVSRLSRYPVVIEGYSDASWISDIKDSRLTSGYNKLAERNVIPKHAIGPNPRGMTHVDSEESTREWIICSNSLTKQAHKCHITDCHVGNPCAHTCDLTVDREYTMIGFDLRAKKRESVDYSTTQIPPPVIPISIPEPDVLTTLPKTTPIPKPDIPKNLPKPNIPYPSRRDNQKSRDKASNQMEKIFQIFQDLRFDISFADALLLMPRFAPIIKSLLMNKEKLLELAKIPLNENCLGVCLSQKASK
ncbi:hypothetical protein Tco_0116605 [Tanacetum coccineum]